VKETRAKINDIKNEFNCEKDTGEGSHLEVWICTRKKKFFGLWYKSAVCRLRPLFQVDFGNKILLVLPSVVVAVTWAASVYFTSSSSSSSFYPPKSQN
jgi:hypothetical protein